MNFASDNTAPVAPEVLAAIAEANHGRAASYGADPWTARLTAKLAEIFEHEVTVFPVATGTAANVLALSTLVRPYGAVICHDEAHIATDEAGAPEFYMGGAKLLTVPTADGLLPPEAIDHFMARADAMGVHHVMPEAVSITHASEWGTIYSADQLGTLGQTCRRYGLALHMDGARFANALVHGGQGAADITWRAGVDALSFGGTKNGALAAEAVIFFDAARAEGFARRRKRGGQLWSKQRYLSAQLLGLLDADLWLTHARQANAMAARLASGLAAIPGVQIAQAVQANEIFAVLPAAVVARLQAAGAMFYDWIPAPATGQATWRFVASFITTAEEVDAAIALARGHGAHPARNTSQAGTAEDDALEAWLDSVEQGGGSPGETRETPSP